jgi:AcrR family transcriptional regulator
MSRDSHKKLKTRKLSRRRLTREQRFRQLLDVSWQLIRKEGTDALTLGRLSECAGVTKPVVYDQFGTRNGLLAALYEDFDVRQTAVIDAALEASKPTLEAKAMTIASAYVDCVLAQGREIPDVLAALAGSPELEQIKQKYQLAFIEKCRGILAPFIVSRKIKIASFWAMLGAADALSAAATHAAITPSQAQKELFEIIIAMVQRAGSR